MYNEDIKQQFISSKQEIYRSQYSVFFAQTEAAEKAKGKDIAEFDPNSIDRFFSSLGIASISTMRQKIFLLKQYAGWYYNNVKPIEREIFRRLSALKMDYTPAIEKEIYRSEAEVKTIFRRVTNDAGLAEIPAVWMTWMGITLKEMLGLKMEDVFERDGEVVVNVKGKEFISDSPVVIDDLMTYKNTTQVEHDAANPYMVYADDQGYYFRAFNKKDSIYSGEKFNMQSIRNRFRYFNRELSDKRIIALPNIELSGIINRMLKYEHEHGEIKTEAVGMIARTKNPGIIGDTLNFYKMCKKVWGIDFSPKPAPNAPEEKK